MPHFFDLPRELRDMIYSEVLIGQRPTPTLQDTQSSSGWNRPWEPKSGLGDHGCAFSSKRAPNTCANFLACNRQINTEMTQTIERARRKGLLAARMDCIAKDEMHYFTWLSIPIVKTGQCTHKSYEKSGIVPTWAVRYLTAPHRALSTTGVNHACRSSSTTIEQLRIDIRLFGNTSSLGNRFETPRDRTSWAICAALKHVFEHDPDIIPTRDCQKDITIDEVILNVIPPPISTYPPPPRTTTHYLVSPTNNAVLEVEKENVNHPEIMAKELVDVWNKLWSGDEFKARYYRDLLKRIKRVRVAVDGVTFRVRELAVELERGQAESRRIEMRMR
ncbi:Nn.00g023230.m01.CDS01 [Neocucurbitaria sp. VM-36]